MSRPAQTQVIAVLAGDVPPEGIAALFDILRAPVGCHDALWRLLAELGAMPADDREAAMATLSTDPNNTEVH